MYFDNRQVLAEGQGDAFWTGTLMKHGTKICSVQGYAMSDTGSSPKELYDDNYEKENHRQAVIFFIFFSRPEALNVTHTARLGSWRKVLTFLLLFVYFFWAFFSLIFLYSFFI